MSFDSILPLLWAMGSINAFVTVQVFVKLLSTHISTQYIIYVSSFILFLLNSLFILKSDTYQPYTPTDNNTLVPSPLKKYFSFNIKNREHFILMLKRQLWNAVTINLLLSSLKYVSISIANALYNLAPIFTFFLQAFFYKKQIERVKLSLTVLSFLGVFIILNPTLSLAGDGFDWHVLMPLAACLATCMNFLYLHEMRGCFKDIQVLEYTYSFHMVTSALWVAAVGSLEDSSSQPQPMSVTRTGIYIVCIAGFTYISDLLRIKTLFCRKPSEVLAFNYTGIIYSILLDMLLFKSRLHFMQILGVLLTSAGLLSQICIDLFRKE